MPVELVVGPDDGKGSGSLQSHHLHTGMWISYRKMLMSKRV